MKEWDRVERRKCPMTDCTMEESVKQTHDAVFGHDGDQKLGLVWKVDQLSIFVNKLATIEKHAWKIIAVVTLGAGASVWNCILEMIKSHVQIH
jgi:hypothetical protein